MNSWSQSLARLIAGPPRLAASGAVSCPTRQRLVDVEECGRCPWLGSVDRSPAGECTVRCRPPYLLNATASVTPPV